MPTQILEPTTLAGTSTEVTVATGSTNTVAMYQGTSLDNLKLPDGVSDFLLPETTTQGNFLLPDGVSRLLTASGGLFWMSVPDSASEFLLLPSANQSSKVMTKKDWATIQLKDPDGEFQDSGRYLRHNGRFKTLGPGVWRIVKTATPREFGFQSE